MRRVKLILAMAGLALSAQVSACVVGLVSDGKTYATIASAFAASQMSDQINISGIGGPCYENLLFTNDHLRIILQGSNGAVISGNAAAPVIDSRTKGIAIINILVNGGSDGIAIRRNANAIIDTVTVQGAASNGISLNEQAYAAIMGSTVQNNGLHGILLARQANANIGFNNTTDALPRPSFITANGGNGVYLTDGSSAYLAFNTISSNQGVGVYVSNLSTARIAGNNISSNALDGVTANGNSYIYLGGYTYPAVHFLDYPNQTTGLNGKYGVACFSNSTIEGHLGAVNQLRGAANQFGGGADVFGVPTNAFSPNCGRTAAFLQVP